MSLRLVFMGTPAFAVPTLAALLDAGHEIVAVYSQPPRPAGRGHHPQPSPVQAFAESRGLPVLTPATLKTPEAQATFAAHAADAGIVAAYGLILPQAVLAAPRLGCLNVHASLLPRWRGAAPIQRAILAGDAATGVTIMQVEAGLDTGAMLMQESVPITATSTATELHDRLAVLGSRLMIDTLAGLAAGTLRARPQPETGVTYAHKLERDEGRLDWTRPAEALDRAVRALNPWPGVWFALGAERIKVLTADLVEGDGAPGTVLDDRLTIACGEVALRPTRLQRPGKAAVDAQAFLRGFPLPAGTLLPGPETASAAKPASAPRS